MTELYSITVSRVDNGWIVRGWSTQYKRHDGFEPAGTYVARTVEEVASIVAEWAGQSVNDNGVELP